MARSAKTSLKAGNRASTKSSTKSNSKPTPPKGWVISGANPEMYDASVDGSNPHSGTKCAYLRHNSNLKGDSAWGTLMQQMGPEPYLDRRLRMSFWIRTKDVKNSVLGWMRVDVKDKNNVAEGGSFDNMCNRPIKKTTGWTQYCIVLDVPGDSTAISFGLVLSGTGHAWLDDVSFEEVGKDVRTTDCPCSSKSKSTKQPKNLNFEE